MNLRFGPVRRAVASALAAASLAGCAAYAPAPLGDGSNVLAQPTREMLAARAAPLQHPRLEPVRIDFGAPLTPEALAAIAVVASPDLQAARAKTGVADAQVFQAGLLPDPQINLAYDKLISDPDVFNAWAGAFIYELDALRTRGVFIAAQTAVREQVRLDIAWPEWQAAGQARLLAARIVGLERGVALNRRSRNAADAILTTVLQASARGDIKTDEVTARRIAAADAADRTRLAKRDLAIARTDLNRLLGLKPDTVVAIAAQEQASARPAPDAAALFERARAERLDLLALQAGYRSQEAAVLRAVMDRFPFLQLTIGTARDTADNLTLGPAINLTLPVFNRNRGGIALARATREQLRAECDARLFNTRSEISALVYSRPGARGCAQS